LAKPGDTVAPGQPLFVIEAADMVQVQNDFIAAITAMNKARSQLAVAEIIEKRHRDLYKDKAVALRELEQAQLGLTAAQNDMRAAETALEAVRNRLRIFGKTDQEIASFEQTGKINAETTIHAPIAGTIVQRKIGPGQYVNSGASDPVFIIGDLSTVWLVAYVRETEAPKVQVGQQIDFTVLAYPDQVFKGNIRYVAATLDTNTRRLLVRATIQNRDGALKPEMYASVTIFTDEGDVAPAVPRDAVIYEGNSARVWVARKEGIIELRLIKPGVVDGRMVQVLDGLLPGEMVVTKGSLFIDRAAAGT
jgi:membrane fusion protein, heavy metal efflux system